MKNIYQKISGPFLVLSLVCFLSSCFDEEKYIDNLMTSQDINLIVDGLIIYHDFDGVEYCPNVVRLFDSKVVQKIIGDHNQLERPISRYSVSKVTDGICQLSVEIGRLTSCTDLDLTIPDAAIMSCEQKGIIKIQFPVSKLDKDG
jgi:hypothetical protein